MFERFKKVFEDIGDKQEKEEAPKFYSETDKPKGQAIIVETKPVTDYFPNPEEHD